MPKVVDPEQRRGELAEAVWRVASRDGLAAVTMRGVAGEAGWSTGSVAHYFSDKEELLVFAFELIADRVRRRMEGHVSPADQPLERVRAQLIEALPLDEERRTEVRLWFGLLGLALTRPALAAAQRAAYRAWRDVLAGALTEAREQGRLAESLDPHAEAAALVALVDGLAVQAFFEPRAMGPKRLSELLDGRLRGLGVPSER